jgi:putative hydrolase of the HAD superfamily
VADRVQACGRDPDPALQRAWAEIEERHHHDWRVGLVTHEEHRRRRLRDFLPLLGVPVGDDAALDEQFHRDYLTRYRRHWRAFDDVDAALVAISAAGLRVGLLTNGMPDQQNAKLDALGLTGRVGPVVTAGGLGVAKPRPEAFRAVCDLLAVEPAETLHVGDDHPVDVAGARAAGMAAVHLDRFDEGPFEEARRMRSLTELERFLA